MGSQGFSPFSFFSPSLLSFSPFLLSFSFSLKSISSLQQPPVKRKKMNFWDVFFSLFLSPLFILNVFFFHFFLLNPRFCFVLFCFVLFCFVLFCFVLFCFVSFCFVLFYFILFYFILFYFILFYFILFYFILFCSFSFRFILSSFFSFLSQRPFAPLLRSILLLLNYKISLKFKYSRYLKVIIALSLLLSLNQPSLSIDTLCIF